ncbi:MAG: AraC family transcriptional regulator [Bacteroidota bacterium]
MLSVPQRLLVLPEVKTLLESETAHILEKKILRDKLGSQSYAAQHFISIVSSGMHQFSFQDETSLKLQAGQVGIFPKGIYTVSDLISQEGEFATILLFFSDEQVNLFLKEIQAKPQRLETTPKAGILPLHELLHPWLQTILSYKTLYGQSSQLIHTKFLELLHLLQAQMMSTYSIGLEQIFYQPQQRNLKEFMMAHFDKALTSEDFAILTGRSVSSFRRDFKRLFGTTPHQWLKDMRLHRAYETLTQMPKSSNELAHEVGYESVSHFISEFKKKYQLTPGQLAHQLHSRHLNP